MKTIGLIGGMSWESSLEYYRIINQTTKERLGGLHSAKIIMYSVDFEEIDILQHQGRWEELTQIMIEAAKRLERGGADVLVICTNTMHKMAWVVKSQVASISTSSLQASLADPQGCFWYDRPYATEAR
jgi:aspartate racemase